MQPVHADLLCPRPEVSYGRQRSIALPSPQKSPTDSRESLDLAGPKDVHCWFEPFRQLEGPLSHSSRNRRTDAIASSRWKISLPAFGSDSRAFPSWLSGLPAGESGGVRPRLRLMRQLLATGMDGTAVLTPVFEPWRSKPNSHCTLIRLPFCICLSVCLYSLTYKPKNRK